MFDESICYCCKGHGLLGFLSKPWGRFRLFSPLVGSLCRGRNCLYPLIEVTKPLMWLLRNHLILTSRLVKSLIQILNLILTILLRTSGNSAGRLVQIINFLKLSLPLMCGHLVLAILVRRKLFNLGR